MYLKRWPANWTVEFEWEWNGALLKSRQHDFRIESSRRNSQWFMFDRFVTNNDNGLTWVDGFDPQGGFVSYRADSIIAVRPHKQIKRKITSEPVRPRARRARGTKKPRR
jgi:hypothetical protein